MEFFPGLIIKIGFKKITLITTLYILAIIIFSSPVLAQSNNTDPCEGVVCDGSTTICPDGFEASCSNSCDPSTGEPVCSSCEPDCTGHDVVQPVCGDEICEGDENPDTCPEDCNTPSPFCGDGICEAGEDDLNCPEDCLQPSSFCGDGFCNGDENPDTCPEDCFTDIVCGDGVCDGPENENSCPEDCGLACPDNYDPVCGDNSKTFSNSCFAEIEGVGILHEGECNICNDGFCDPWGTDCPEDCGEEFCPDSITCPDGSSVSCFVSGDSCECDSCPLPSECEEVEDEQGFVHVECEVECPSIPQDLADECSSQGGVPEHRTGHDGCEYLECEFRDRPVNPFIPGECPSEDQVQDHLSKCEQFGQKGVIIEERGCRVAVCKNERFECKSLTEDIKENLKRQCGEENVITDFDSMGCEFFRCGGPDFCRRHIPDEFYRRCESDGGEVVVKKDMQGCIVFDECVRRGDQRDVFYEEVDRVPPVEKLLGISLKLENLIQKLDELSRETRKLADYYASVGSLDENRFRRASSMFEDAKFEVNEIKTRLRDNLEFLTKRDIEDFKLGIKRLREGTLKDITYVMLSSSEDAVSRFEREEQFEPEGFEEFNQALMSCEKAKWMPDRNVEISLEGLDELGRCVLKAKALEGPPGFDISMECRIEKFSRGFIDMGPNGPNAQLMDDWNCVGPMADGIRSGQFQGEAPPPEAFELMKQLQCSDEQSCRDACSKSENFDKCSKLRNMIEGPQEEFRHGGEFREPEFRNREREFNNEFGGREACSGCLDNGVCDIGECSDCYDCLGG